MARSVQASPFLKKLLVPQSRIENGSSETSSTSEFSSDPIVNKEDPSSEVGMTEFTSPRTIQGQAASSLGDTPSNRRSTRLRNSTLLNSLTIDPETSQKISQINQRVEALSLPKSQPLDKELFDFVSKSSESLKKKVEEVLMDLESKPEDVLLYLINCILI